MLGVPAARGRFILPDDEAESAPAASYADRSAVAAFLEPALEQVRTIPRVESVAAITAPPYVSWGNDGTVRYERRPADDPSRQPIVEFRSVTPDFFAVTGQRLLGGRLLRASDDERPETPAVVVVHQALVDRDFHGVSPLDPVAWALAALRMVLGGVAASLVPARRATRVDPTIAMRVE